MKAFDTFVKVPVATVELLQSLIGKECMVIRDDSIYGFITNIIINGIVWAEIYDLEKLNNIKVPLNVVRFENEKKFDEQ